MRLDGHGIVQSCRVQADRKERGVMDRKTALARAGTLAAAMLLAASGGPRAAGPEAGAPAADVQPQEAKMDDGTTRELIEGRVLPVDFDVRRLDTGLTVSLVPFDSPGLAAYFTAMRVGSRDEVEAGHSGFAHLFEHMMFRGTKKMPGSVYDQKVQALGADSSAWTWNDQTVYFFIAPTEALPDVIAMEAERFQNLSYEEPEFKTESGAVLGEYNKNFSDPLNQMEEDLMNLAFERSTYRHTTMGFVRDIKAMPSMYGYSLKFFDRHYVPSKAVITVVGDFDKDEVMARIRDEYATWTRPGAEVTVPEEPAQKAERRMHREWKNPVLAQMMVGYKVPAYDNSSVDFAALTLIGEMVLGKTSPLYRKLVLEEQSVEDIEFWDWPHRDPCLWLFTMKFKKEDFDGALADVDAMLGDIIEGKTSEERLAAVKSHYRYAFVLSFETPRAVANTLSFYATLDGDPAGAERFLARVDEVTLEDLRRVAAAYLVPAGRTVVTLSHAGEKGGE
jgi:zinc protease